MVSTRSRSSRAASRSILTKSILPFGCRGARRSRSELKIPILASAMDGVVDVRFAVAMSKLGGLAVLNLEGVQTRYKNPQEVLEKIVEADKNEITALCKKFIRNRCRRN